MNLDNLPGGKLDNIHTEITRPRNRNVNAPWTFYVDMTYDNLCQFMSKHHEMSWFHPTKHLFLCLFEVDFYLESGLENAV